MQFKFIVNISIVDDISFFFGSGSGFAFASVSGPLELTGDGDDVQVEYNERCVYIAFSKIFHFVMRV